MLMAGVIAAPIFGQATPRANANSPVKTVQSREVALHYRLRGASETARIELWYTRDRSAASWQLAGIDEDGQPPIVFTAPSEGLYGFTMLVRDGERVSRQPPQAYESPQHWVFVDYTPPLVQWDRVVVSDDFARSRLVHLHWTAFDSNLTSRPVGLFYRLASGSNWQVVDRNVANLGRYDWQVPAEIGGTIRFKLTVQDQGGHVVEREHGPVELPRSSVRTQPALTRVPQTQPYGSTTTRPAETDNVSVEQRRIARERHQQGVWHLERGQYAVAAERFTEALEFDPTLLESMVELAHIHAHQDSHARALDWYLKALKTNGEHDEALRGAALAYVKLRRYAQSKEMLKRRLALDEKNAEAWLDLGDVLFMAGDPLSARTHWQRALRVDASAQTIIKKAKVRLEKYSPNASSTPQGYETADASGQRK